MKGKQWNEYVHLYLIILPVYTRNKTTVDRENFAVNFAVETYCENLAREHENFLHELFLTRKFPDLR